MVQGGSFPTRLSVEYRVIGPFQRHFLSSGSYRKSIGFDHKQHVTNISVRAMVTAEIGKHQELLENVKTQGTEMVRPYNSDRRPSKRVSSGYRQRWTASGKTKEEMI